VLNVRKFGVVPLTPTDLLSRGAIGLRMLAFLAACVGGRANMVISGEQFGQDHPARGFVRFVPDGERLVTIEDVAELRLAKHVIAFEASPPNVEGRGEVTVRDLVRNALRMPPTGSSSVRSAAARRSTCSGDEHGARRVGLDRHANFPS
jgi:pilus assembly protein CpaF